MRLVFLFLAFILAAVEAHEESAIITNLTATDLYQGIQNGDFDVLVDVRSAEEYTAGHIANATFMENLAVEGFPNAKPDDLAGCEHCRVALYCRSGARAAVAAAYLMEAGFHNLYNGGGINQWTEAGYTLVTGDDSVVPPCTVDTSEQCNADSLGSNNSTTEEDGTPEASPAAVPSAGGTSSSGDTLWSVSRVALFASGMMLLL